MAATVTVRVVPKSSRDEVAGRREGDIVVRVTAPPEQGKANAAVCRVVAGVLGVPKSAVTVLRGTSSRRKTLAVAGLSDAEVEERLSGV